MLIEIVGQDDAEKHTARQRWAAYRQRGYELKAFDAERRVALCRNGLRHRVTTISNAPMTCSVRPTPCFGVIAGNRTLKRSPTPTSRILSRPSMTMTICRS